MSFGDWKINGISPQWIESVDWKEYPNKITLHCAAYPEEYESAREEIQRFNKIAANDIKQQGLMNGGIDLQISADGQIVIITEGSNVWQGAIDYPKFTETSRKSGVVHNNGVTILVNEVIEWDITIHFLITVLPPAAIYTPDLRVYPNIDYEAYNQENALIAVTEIGQTVVQGIYPNTSGTTGNPNPNWSNIANVEANDGLMASVIGNGTGGTDSIDMSNFGFNIPSMNIVTRVRVRIRYANSSTTSGKLHYVKVSGPNMSVPLTPPIVVNSDPDHMNDAIFDTANNTLPNFSSDPATYNSNDFNVQIAANLDKFKTCWIDYIEVIIWHQPVYGYYADFEGSDLADFITLSGTFVENNNLLTCTVPGPPEPGNGIGAVVTEETYQPMVIEAKIVIAPSNKLGFVFGRIGSDLHWEAIYLGGGNWRIVTINDAATDPAITKASAQAWNLVGNTTYWFKVTISPSGLIKFYCNNTLMVQYNNGAAIPEGNVGLRCWGAAGSTFDKFKIAQTVPTDDPSFTGADIGDLIIVERRPVKSVEVIGSACNLPAWLEVNGERHDWKFSHSHDSGDTGHDGIQTLVFTISPPDTVLEFSTSPNYPPSLSGYTAAIHAGSTIKQIKVIYA